LLNAINSFPRGRDKRLRRTYEEILRQATEDSRNEKLVASIKLILSIVITSAVPLTLKELDDCLAADENDSEHIWLEREITNACRGLLTIKKGVVRPFHATLKTYLENAHECLAVFHIGTQEAHAQLAERCLKYTARCLALTRDSGGEEVNRLTSEYAFVIGGAEVNVSDEDGVTPLHNAAQYGHEGVVKLLIDAAADVNAANKDGVTPLYVASLNGHVEVVKLLINAGADINAADNDGGVPLSLAASNGHVEVARLLINIGAALSFANNEDHLPLNLAASNWHLEVVKLLHILGKFDLDTADTQYGRTPLSYAAGNGHAPIVKLLLTGGEVNPNSKDNICRTPLLCSKERKSTAITLAAFRF